MITFVDILQISNITIIINDTKVMNLAADNIRILAASMVEKAKSGHPGGSFQIILYHMAGRLAI